MLNLIIVYSRGRSMLPVPPAVGPAFSFELDVEDGEVENYEVGVQTTAFKEEMLAHTVHKLLFYFAFDLAFAFQINVMTVKTEFRSHPFKFLQYWILEVLSFIFCLLLFPRIHLSRPVIIKLLSFYVLHTTLLLNFN